MGTGRQLLSKAGGLGSTVAGATAGSQWESIPSALGSRPKSARHISYAQPAPLSGGGRRLLFVGPARPCGRHGADHLGEVMHSPSDHQRAAYFASPITHNS